MRKLQKKAVKIDLALSESFPNARVELDFATPVELLVATMLSAQSTDVKVNQVTKSLFLKYPTLNDYLCVSLDELESDIRSIGLYRQKAKNIRAALNIIHEKFEGVLPSTIDSLLSLPGIGRKSANVILGNIFGIPGIVVDTHVSRVSRRLGLTIQNDPVKIERELGNLLPKRKWTKFGQRAVLHGRYVCKARKPLCEDCNIISECISEEKVLGENT
ncbi:MAG: endonuclease III [Candidatus Latescibacterota bacterium]|nr:endonuclease III [Candidatus Latescibacterota bacterium]